MANRAYGYPRLSPPEVMQRLGMGDDGKDANRVLHVAFRLDPGSGDEILVGCCSSTRQTPWCPRGCGHWGLLVVDVEAQGTGVASALVRAAEQRLRSHGLQSVQIEYEYTRGDPASERLYAWYEGSLGFSGGGPPGRSEFRRCRKKLAAPREDKGDQTSSGAMQSHGASPFASSKGKEAPHSAVVSKPNVRCWAILLRIYRRLLG
jgi:GNAT superfamily N-acetyltransferase